MVPGIISVGIDTHHCRHHVGRHGAALVLDLKWGGLLENGIRVYDINAYQMAFGVIIGLCILGTFLIIFAKETFCQQLHE